MSKGQRSRSQGAGTYCGGRSRSLLITCPLWDLRRSGTHTRRPRFPDLWCAVGHRIPSIPSTERNHCAVFLFPVHAEDTDFQFPTPYTVTILVPWSTSIWELIPRQSWRILFDQHARACRVWYCYGKSVRPSVCPSHSGIVSKRMMKYRDTLSIVWHRHDS